MLRAVLFLSLPLLAGEEVDAEKLRLSRAAMEAKIKVGDLLLQQGDARGAMRAYEEALEIFREASERAPLDGRRAGPEAAAPRSVPEAGPERDGAKAIDLGLRWLSSHQSEDGSWDADGFAALDPKDDPCDGPGQAHYDPGVTGLALLAFFGAGCTDRGEEKENPHASTVRNGLRYLLSIQDAEGVFGPRTSQHFIYNHAFATLALSEAWGMTRNPRYREPAERAVNWILRARNPYLGWRYGERSGENDTAVTGLCVMALASAKAAGLAVDPQAFEGAVAWLDKMTDPDTGRVGYIQRGGGSARLEGMQDRFPVENSEATTAIGLLTRFLCGATGREPEILRGAALCAAKPPVWDPERGTIDMYYWWFGSMALFRVGGDVYSAWNKAALPQVLAGQWAEGSGSRTGSWDPLDPWGPAGGRVYSTALMTLTLEGLHRHLRANR